MMMLFLILLVNHAILIQLFQFFLVIPDIVTNHKQHLHR